MPSLKARQRLRGEPGFERNSVLLKAEFLAAESHCSAKFFEGLHIDKYVKISRYKAIS